MDDLSDRLSRSLGARYRIERELGRGGMGIVYLASDAKLGRPVALKVLRPEIAASLGAERFLREIRIAARLSHPHILSLIDSGEADGLLYYVMFYVEGESLRDLLKEQTQLPVDRALRWTRELAEALDHAHQHEVVHRDVKPANVLLENGHALLCDFGVARAVGEAGGDDLTATGLVVGTAEYMSPEQGLGGAGADRRSDVYSLACVLYEMLSGAVPFASPTAQAMMARRAAEEVPGLRVVREGVPVHVERALKKALSPVPADRFETAGDFARALETPGRAARRLPRWAASALRLGAVGVVGGMALLLFGRSEPPAELRTTFTQVTHRPGIEDSPSLSPDGRQVVYAADDGTQRDIFLQDVGGQRPFNLTVDSPADDYSPAFSVDGEWIAFRSTRDGGGIYVMRRTGEALRRVTDRGNSPAWSPDGTRLAYVLEYVALSPLNMKQQVTGLWTVDVATGASVELVRGDAVLPSWSPNGKWIAYTVRGDGSNLWLVPADGGEPVQLTSDEEHDWGPTWSSDGAFVYFSSNRRGSMNLWRLPVDKDRGTPLGAPQAVTTPSAFVAHPSVSDDGTRVVYSSVLTEQNIELAPFDPDAETIGDPVPLTTGSRKWSSPDLSPDGARVTMYSLDLPEGDLYVVRRDGSGLRQLTGDPPLDRVPRWSRDGTEIAYFSDRSGEIQTWLIRADGSGNRRLTFGEGATTGGWSPDGTRMVFNGLGWPGYVMDTSLGWDEQERPELATDTAWGWMVANEWSPDGRRLAATFGYADEGVGYYDLATGEHVALSDFGEWPTWLPDSERLLFVTGGNAFYIADARTGEVREIYSTTRDVLGPPRLTADGTEMVYSRRATEADIWLVTLH